MNNKIDNKKLPIKYFLRTYSLMDSYPTTLDVLFDLASDDLIVNGNQFDYNYAKVVLVEKIPKEKFEELASKLCSNNFLEEIVTGKKKMYKLLNHPWE